MSKLLLTALFACAVAFAAAASGSDEFAAPAGSEPVTASTDGASAPKEQAAPKLSASQVLAAHDWTYELLALAAIAVVVFMHTKGRAAASSAANSVGASALPILSAEFASVGGEAGAALTDDGGNQWHVWASGRRGVLGLNMVLALRSRNDLVGSLISAVAPSLAGQMGGPTIDTLTVEVALPAQGGPGLLVHACREAERTDAQAAAPEIKELSPRSVSAESLLGAGAGALAIVADSRDAAAASLGGPEMQGALAALGGPSALRLFHLTDVAGLGECPLKELSPRMLRLVVALPADVGSWATAVPAVLRGVIAWVDRYASGGVTLPAGGTAAWRSAREGYQRSLDAAKAKEAAAKAAEAAKTAKADALAAEKARIAKIADPAKRRKEEEKLKAAEMGRGYAEAQRKMAMAKGLRGVPSVAKA